MVIEIYDREAMGEVTAREIAIINEGLIAEFGEGGAMSPGQISYVLLEEKLPIRFDQILRMMTHTEKYENIFSPLIPMGSLAQAEDAISKIDEFWRKFKRLEDRTGVRFALEAAREARKLALENSTSPRVSAANRAVQAEVAAWVLVWLQTPALFPQWLDLRKRAADFIEKFGEAQRGATSASAPPITDDADDQKVLGKDGA